MAGLSDGGGERRRALREERTGTRAGAHAAPALTPAAAQAAHRPAAQPTQQTAPTQPVPSAPAPAPLPSRRDRAALRRPTALDEPAVAAGDTALWRSLAAADDPGASAVLQTHAPLTRALARSIAGHLTSPAPSLGPGAVETPPAAPAGRAATRRDRPADWDAPAAPLVPAFVPRRRSAPLESGPLDQVAPSGRDELPPPPSAAEVEAALLTRTPLTSTPVRTAPVRPAVPSATPTALPTSSSTSRSGPTSGSTLALTSAELEALRTAAAVAAEGLPATPPAGTATLASRAPAASGATSSVPTTSRAAGRPTTSRTAGRPAAGDTARTARSGRPAQPPASRHTRPGAAAASRRWYQRRALGLSVGVLTAAAALVVAVGVFTDSGRQLTPALLSAVTGSGSEPSTTPGAATPPASTPEAAATGAAPQDDAAAQDAAGAPASDEAAAAQGEAAPAASQAAAAPAASAPATAAIPTGDVTYEGFGTAKNTYVELGTADAFEARTDLGATFDQPMAGSAAWPGWYVGVRSQDGEGTVGCRIKDASGAVLVEEQSDAGDLVLCDLGSPAEFS